MTIIILVHGTGAGVIDSSEVDKTIKRKDQRFIGKGRRRGWWQYWKETSSYDNRIECVGSEEFKAYFKEQTIRNQLGRELRQEKINRRRILLIPFLRLKNYILRQHFDDSATQQKSEVIEVHPLNDNPDPKRKWWISDSYFVSDMNELLKSEDGKEIEWKQFLWDGKNSETSRREAGEDLFEYMVSIEKGQETQPYHLIGHSHGGSVVIEALRQSVLNNRDLPRLRSWTTIGSPFLNFARNKNPLAGLSPLLQVIFVIISIYSLSVLIKSPRSCDRDIKTRYDMCAIEFDGRIDTEAIGINIDNILIDLKLSGFEAYGQIAREGDENSKFHYTPKPFGLNHAADQDFSTFDTSPFFLEDNTLNPRLREIANIQIERFVKSYLHSGRTIDVCDEGTQNLFKLGELNNPILAQRCADGYDEIVDPLEEQITELWYNKATLPEKPLEYTIRDKGGSILFIQSEFSRDYPSINTNVYELTETVKQSVIGQGLRPKIVYYGAVLLPLFLYISLVLFVRYFRNSELKLRQSPKFANDLRERFWHLWINIWHAEDEAINAISNSPSVPVDLAPRRLLSGFVKLIIALAALWFLLVYGRYDPNLPYSTNILANLIEFRTSIEHLMHPIKGLSPWDDIPSIFMGLLKMWGGLTMIAVFIILIGEILERIVLIPLARRKFNINLKRGLLNAVFGDDVRILSTESADSDPHESEAKWSALPAEVDEVMQDYVSKYLDQILGKFREYLGMKNGKSVAYNLETLLQSLTWNELIHTSYFDLREVRRIIAAGLISSGDFKAHDSFETHAKAKSWLDEMRPEIKKLD